MLERLQKGSDTLREVLIYFVVLTIIAGASFSYFEGTTFFDGYYWANVTASSTGYGDITPKTIGGKITAIFTMLSGLIIYAMVVYRVMEALAPDRNEFSHEEQVELMAKVDKLIELSSGQSKS